jgi:hypothetical protein
MFRKPVLDPLVLQQYITACQDDKQQKEKKRPYF